jgi:hypothetical protein
MSHAQIEVMIAELRKSVGKIEDNLDVLRVKTRVGPLDLQILRILDDTLKGHETRSLQVAPSSSLVQAAELLELSEELVRLRQLVRSTARAAVSAASPSSQRELRR